MEVISFKIKRVQRVNIIPNSNVCVDVFLRGVILSEVVNKINEALIAKYDIAPKDSKTKLLQIAITEK